MRNVVKIIVILLAVFAVLVLLGPRPDLDVTPRSFEIHDVAEFVLESEASVPGIVAGAEKAIVWNGTMGERTELAIVYLHGFSATRQETAPLCDSIAAGLGANLFYTRLAGHGRGGAPMAEATVDDWFNDVSEAVAVGRALGDRVVIVGNSTGSTLAVWWLGSPHAPIDLKSRVTAMVLMSPNFAPADPNASIVLWPWGEHLAKLVIGDERSWEPHNELQGRFWTTSYPTEAVVPVMAAVRSANALDPATFRMPTMVVYSPNDMVVDASLIPDWFSRLGSRQKRLLEISQSSDPSNHILAGDIMSPETTEMLAAEVGFFLRSNVLDVAR